MSVEWGVKHSQGIRLCSSEAAAISDLEWLTQSWEKGKLRHVEASRPVIVSRTVSPWLPVDEQQNLTN